MAVPNTLKVFEVFDNDEITRENIEQAATLFSREYGIWGPQGPRPGERIRMSASKLKDQIFPELFLGKERRNEYRLVRFLVDGVTVGHAAACYYDWVISDEPLVDHTRREVLVGKIRVSRDVCWVTQLVVKKEWRGKGIAKQLLVRLNKELEEGHRYGRRDRTCYGILSSSPFAIMAAWRAFGQANKMIKESDLELLTLKECTAAKILENGSEIPYLRTAASQLRGTVFAPSSEDGSVCSAFTNFFVDHAEPREALQMVEARGNRWPFGKLGDGCEYLLIMVGAEEEL